MWLDTFDIRNYRFIHYVNLPVSLQKQIYDIRILDSIRYRMSDDRKFSYEEHSNFILSLKNDSTKSYWAVSRHPNSFLASVSLHPINLDEKWAEWGIYIHPEYEGKGIAKEIGLSFFEYLAQNTCLEKIRARVKSDNVRSIAFHQRIGFLIVETTDTFVNMEKIISYKSFI
jgi:RimJ/RimL family protein N-acetyltransferase